MNLLTLSIVDDHLLFRSALKALISNHTNYKILLEANDGEDFLSKISKKFYPDIVLLDLNMPKMNGLDLTRHLKINFPSVKVIILSMELENTMVMELIKAGIDGYILKDTNKDELITCLDTVASNDVYFCKKVNGVIKNILSNKNDDKNIINLKPKEIEFLKLVCRDLSYKEIAAELNISIRTAENLKLQLCNKIEVSSKIGLVLYAIKNKIVKI